MAIDEEPLRLPVFYWSNRTRGVKSWIEVSCIGTGLCRRDGMGWGFGAKIHQREEKDRLKAILLSSLFAIRESRRSPRTCFEIIKRALSCQERERRKITDQIDNISRSTVTVFLIIFLMTFAILQVRLYCMDIGWAVIKFRSICGVFIIRKYLAQGARLDTIHLKAFVWLCQILI